MENRTILAAFVATWCAYLCFVYIWAWRRRLHLGGVSFTHIVPSAVAVTMTYVFYIKAGMDLWSHWYRLWPAFLAATAASGLVYFILTIYSCVDKSERNWIPVTIAGTVMSAFAFFTVVANFPDA